MGSVDFSNNQLGATDGKAFDDDFNGINTSELNLSNNRISVFPKQLFSTGSPITTLNLMANMLAEIEEGDLQGENTHLITSIDLRFNRLSELPDDFRATTIPYLQGFDISYNRCAKFPTNVLNCYELQAIGVRHQRDEQGNRILREWPEGITNCPSLLQLQIGGNDIRKGQRGDDLETVDRRGEGQPEHLARRVGGLLAHPAGNVAAHLRQDAGYQRLRCIGYRAVRTYNIKTESDEIQE